MILGSSAYFCESVCHLLHGTYINFMSVLRELVKLFKVFSLVAGTWSLVSVCYIIVINHWPITHFTSQIVADISICGLASLPRSDAWNTFIVAVFCQTTVWILSLAVLLSVFWLNLSLTLTSHTTMGILSPCLVQLSMWNPDSCNSFWLIR